MSFLGEMEARRGEEIVVLPSSRKTRALLAYLCVTGRPHRRDRLCDLLWEETDDPRAALRWSLTKLRGVVDEDATRIVADRETVAFEGAGARIDVHEIRADEATIETLEIEEVERLAGRFRGGFLERLELTDLRDFHAWCVAEREEMRRAHVRVLDFLLERLGEDPERALPHARALVAVDGASERAHARLVALLGAAGRRSEAEQRYEAGSAQLAEARVAPTGELLGAWQEARTPGAPPSSSGSRAVAAEATMARPETRYARAGGVHIAYQVVGDGPPLLFIPGWVSHVEHAWEEPTYAHFLRSLASFSRLVLMDRRGTGLSDPVAELPTLERRMEDVLAVLDAADIERAAIFGISESGPMAMLFAATYPERTAALALYGTFARLALVDDDSAAELVAGEDYEVNRGLIRELHERTEDMPREALAVFLDFIEATWGTGEATKLWAPSIAGDADVVARWARFERMSVSPGAARRLFEMVFGSDATNALHAISAPTVCMGREDDDMTPWVRQQYIADRIPEARLVKFEGDDHFPWIGDSAPILAEIERHVTGSLAKPTAEPDRVLATVLFTDIVGSTARLAEIGDRQWRELLRRHHEIVREQLASFRGSEVDTAGDGILATFDGPARGIRCARAIVEAVKGVGLDVRAGLHTGECEMFEGKVAGIAVHIGARCAAEAAAGEVLVSRTVRDLVAGSGIEFESRGPKELKGVPGTWELLRVLRA